MARSWKNRSMIVEESGAKSVCDSRASNGCAVPFPAHGGDNAVYAVDGAGN